MVPHRRDLMHLVMPDGRRLLQHETGIGACGTLASKEGHHAAVDASDESA